MKNRNDDLIVGLDIGSNKIVAAISEIDEKGNLSVLGLGSSETNSGIRAGVVINIDSIATSINNAVEEAEIQAGREIKGVFVGISGANIETINSKGVVAISGPEKEIKESDINRVIEAAKAVAIPMDREILHIIPQGFTVDGQSNIKYPLGIVGTRLECQIHIVTTPISSIQNLIKCIDRCGIEIYDIILQNLAASRAVLEDDEKEMGVLMLDVGAETTKLSLYYRGFPYFQSIYPLGGYLITNDIAAGLKVSLSTAEKIKQAYGVTDFNYVDADESIQIPSVGGRKPRLLARENLIHIIKPRIVEMMTIIKNDIKEKELDKLMQGGVVITGGTSLIPGIAEVVQEVFEVQGRVGIPKKMHGLNDKIQSSEFAVVNGLLLWGYDRMNKYEEKTVRKEVEKGSLLTKIKKIFNEFF